MSARVRSPQGVEPDVHKKANSACASVPTKSYCVASASPPSASVSADAIARLRWRRASRARISCRRENPPRRARTCCALRTGIAKGEGATPHHNASQRGSFAHGRDAPPTTVQKRWTRCFPTRASGVALPAALRSAIFGASDAELQQIPRSRLQVPPIGLKPFGVPACLARAQPHSMTLGLFFRIEQATQARRQAVTHQGPDWDGVG